MMFSIEGKKALVTGASGGIGGAIAVAFAKQGAQVILAGRRRAALDETARRMDGDNHRVVCADLADDGDVERLRDCIRAEKIDLLVNNAGLTRDGLAMRLPKKDWDDVMAVNLAAAFRLSQSALAVMMRKRWGRIISISSVVASSGNAGQAAYVASKAGLEGMTRSLAREVAGRSVTVNSVAPGYIETAMTAKMDEGRRTRLLESIPCARPGNCDEVAAAVSFLASEEASYITGQILHVNGGMIMT